MGREDASSDHGLGGRAHAGVSSFGPPVTTVVATFQDFIWPSMADENGLRARTAARPLVRVDMGLGGGSTGEQGAHERHRPPDTSSKPLTARHVAGRSGLPWPGPRRVLPHFRRRGGAGARLLLGLRYPRDVSGLGSQERRALRG